VGAIGDLNGFMPMPKRKKLSFLLLTMSLWLLLPSPVVKGSRLSSQVLDSIPTMLANLNPKLQSKQQFTLSQIWFCFFYKSNKKVLFKIISKVFDFKEFFFVKLKLNK